MAKKTEQSIGEYQKRNPTEKEAKSGPNREKKIMASQKEENSIDSRGTVEFLPGG